MVAEVTALTAADRAQEGARNLLVGCGGWTDGDEVLVVREDPALGWYDQGVSRVVIRMATRLGMSVRTVSVGAPTDQRSPDLDRALADSSNVVFLARIGDQDRFEDPGPGRTIVMSYARTEDQLASSFARTPHAAMAALKAAVNQVLIGGRRIQVTCANGTKLEGEVPPVAGDEPVDVGVRRFPLGVPAPVPAATFNGSIAIRHFLTPTGSQPYEPASVPLSSIVVGDVVDGRFNDFKGEPDDVRLTCEHYSRVARLFDIDERFIHSWHAGLHPGCGYDRRPDADPDHWSNTVFNSPRVLHFHTCGAYAPGEISVMIFDPTVLVDGVALWSKGRLQPQSFGSTAATMEHWPDLRRVYSTDPAPIGL